MNQTRSTPSPFTSGPRLTDSPRGDPAAQALASLRGYAYQLYASGLAWIALKPGEALYLEVAKDFAVVTEGALRAVEVKDTAASSATINSEGVRETLDGFVDLVERNPDLTVHLRYLTTSAIGTEQDTALQAGGEATLRYWRRAAAGADAAPLRGVLLRAKLSARVHAYITALGDDTSFRDKFLRRIHWDCGQPSLDGMAYQFGQQLLVRARSFNATSAERDRIAAMAIHHVLKTILSRDKRRLTHDDLMGVLGKATEVTLRRHDFDAIMGAVAATLSGAGQAPVQVTGQSSAFEPEAEIPFPPNMAERAVLTADVIARARTHGTVFLSGMTGVGKTLVARLAARHHGNGWAVVDFRDVSPEEAVIRLDRAATQLDTFEFSGLILDDFNEVDEPRVARALARFAAALVRCDMLCIITAYNPPSARAYSSLGLDAGAHVTVSNLTRDEVTSIVSAAGADPKTWGQAVYFGSKLGHPQLVQALLLGLRTRGWPQSEIKELILRDAPDLEAEQLVTRRRLVAAVPPDASALLYRLSLLIGSFERPLALLLGALYPAIINPGAQIDLLVGPWIEAVGRKQLRISPLLQRAGNEVLSQQDQVAVHAAAAKALLPGRSLDVLKANSAVLHGLLGKAIEPLMKVAYGVMTASANERKILSEHLSVLRLVRLDRPIIDGPIGVALTLRLAQFVLVAETDDVAKIRACWKVLQREIADVPDTAVRDHFEYLSIAKLMLNQSASGTIPGWIDLILRFEALSNKDATLQTLLTAYNQPINGHGPPSALGLFFVTKALGLRRVADLEEAFDRLEKLTPDKRRELLAGGGVIPGDFSMIVNRPWLQEQRSDSHDATAAAEAYGRMAFRAQSWGVRELSLRCHVARAVLLDEYAHDATVALTALDSAVQALGEDPVLSRARARIHFHQKDHKLALGLLRETAGQTALNDPIERTYMLREAGISAAELGEWAEARQWFEDARTASEKAAETLRFTAIGLRCDAGIAAFKAGDSSGALKAVHAALREIGTLNPRGEKAEAYCCRVIGHAILWLHIQVTGLDPHINGELTAMVPGMCSNPEPPDIRDLQTGAIEYTQYMLAQTELSLGIDVGITTWLLTTLKERAMPGMEIGLRNAHLVTAIQGLDAVASAARLGPWIDAAIYLDGNRDRLLAATAATPVFGEIPATALAERNGPRGRFVAEDSVQAFALMAALAKRTDALQAFTQALDTGDIPTSAKDLAAIMTGARTPSDSVQDCIAAEIGKVAARDDLTPDDLFVASLRFVQGTKNSDFNRLLEPRLAAWVRSAWERVIDEQAFYLRNPMTSVPALREALDAPKTGFAFVGGILLAASSAVQTRIDSSFREFLGKL